MRKVLVFPGGTEIGLEINKALAHCKDIELHSAGANVSNHAPFVFARHHIVPDISAEGWLDALKDLISRQGIEYVLPAHDDVVLALARHSHEIDAKVVTSPLRTCEITRSKRRTYELLDGVIPVPQILDPLDPDLSFPVFVKPDIGQGSAGAKVVRDRVELEGALRERADLLVMELLPGDEYTVDCFSDRDEGLMFCAGRRRVRMRSGISMDSYDAPVEGLRALAEAICSRLELHGAWFFQVRRDAAGVLCLLEVAPRIAGTMALHRVQGVNFPLLAIYESEGLPLRVLTNDVAVRIDRALVNRYQTDLTFDTVYVDLDDTLVVRGVVNTELVRFLYQCVGRGIRIVVLTRHAEDPLQTLDRLRLGQLPDEVIHLGREGSKADHITSGSSIFVDDSFAERLSVAESIGVPTFDCSMIEMLLDDRM